MAQHKLSATGINKIRKPGYRGDGGNLYLQTTKGKSGLSKSWIFRYGWHGRTREMGLGSLELVSLAQARDKALACRRLLLEGHDPITAKRDQRTQAKLAAAKAVTFRQVADRYLESHRVNWKGDPHWGATLKNYAYPIIGNLPVAAVDTDAVMRVLRPIWTSKPETASRLRGRIERVLNSAKAQEQRTGDNPARWRGHLDTMLPKPSKVKTKQHHAALPYAALPAFMAELRDREGIPARALEFLILTACRTGDICGQKRDDKPAMQWDHITRADKLWKIPHTKNGKELRVPLSGRCLEILKALPREDDNPHVFIGRGSGAPMGRTAMAKLLKEMRPDLTVHGFRSTFRTWAGEQTNFPPEVCEAALAHTTGTATEQAYQRGDLFEKRRLLLAEWAQYCEKPIVAGDVILLRGRGHGE